MDSKHLIEHDGLEVRVVSGAGTGGHDITGKYCEVTEVQAGSYIVMDSSYRTIRPEFECALSVVTMVTSAPSSERVMFDAGRRSVSQDFRMPEVRGMEGLTFQALREEHGVLESTGVETCLGPGDKIEATRSHNRTTVDLHDKACEIWDIVGGAKSQYKKCATAKYSLLGQDSHHVTA